MSDARSSRRMLAGIAVLVALTAGATMLLSLVDDATETQRQQNRALHEARLLGAVIPPGDYDAPPGLERISRLQPGLLEDAATVLEAYPVYRNGAAVALIVTVVAPEGYVAPLKLLVGIMATGQIYAVRVAEHRETPGLGDKVEAARSDWITDFDGRSLENPVPGKWQLRRDGGDFDHISGATITSRAALGAVRDALEFANTHREILYAAPVKNTD